MPDRRDVDQLLDQMDDVITGWEGSSDSMRWRLDALGDDLSDAGRRFAEAWRPAIQQLSASLGVLLRAFQTPEMRALLTEAVNRPQVDTADCHCLCQMNHELDGRCLGTVPEGEIRVAEFRGVEVPMCAPCAGLETPDA